VLPTDPISDGVLTLRLPAGRDVPRLVEACQDPEIPRWTMVPSPYSEADGRGWVAEAARLAAAGEEWPFLLVGADDGLLGSVGLVGLDLERGSVEIGYWIAPWARGRGLAARGAVLVRDAAVARLGARRAELLIHRDNAASVAVALRAGFVSTGQVKPCARGGSDEPDHLVYAWEP